MDKKIDSQGINDASNTHKSPPTGVPNIPIVYNTFSGLYTPLNQHCSHQQIAGIGRYRHHHYEMSIGSMFRSELAITRPRLSRLSLVRFA